MFLLARWLITTASAHGGSVPTRGVYDWSQLPAAEPGVWVVWTLFPTIVIGCLLFSLGYEWVAGPLRRKYSLSDVPPTFWDRVRFHGGIAVVFVALQGPLHELSDIYLFSAHMIQHLLITLIFPLLALSGIPPWMWRPVFANRTLFAIGKRITHPAFAFLFSTGILYFWHIPALYDLALRDHNWHIVEHLLFMASAVIMWWPASNRSEALPRLTPGWRLVYLFGLTIPMKALGALITTSDWVLYNFYTDKPRVFGLDPSVDQRVGGLIMWLPGGLVFWVTMAITFFAAYDGLIRSRTGSATASERSHA